MSGSNGALPPLHLIEGGRSADGSSTRKEQELSERLAALLARGASASGHGEDFAADLARAYLEKAAEAPKAKTDSLDPLARHTERVEGDRGGQALPASEVFGGILDAVPKHEPGTLPVSVPSDARPIADAAASAQAGYRPRGGRKRARRDQRRRQRREYDRKRLEEVREGIFSAHGQTPDIPDIPALRPEIFGMNLQVMRDGTGRQACEVLAKLPLGQVMEALRMGYAALPFVRAGRTSAFSRADAHVQLPKGRDELVSALEQVRDEVMPTEWFRREVCAAWGMWSHRGKPLSEAARKAARGGVFIIEGFSQNALSWLVPRPDGTRYSRSVLWGPNGPFTLLAGASHRLGRKAPGESGAGLYTRWQQPAGVAKYKGPTKKNPKTGELERFAVAQTRYDAPMAGRTAASLARRARGALRELARTVVSVLTPWVELPEPRTRKRPSRPEEAEDGPPSVELGVDALDARAPP